MNQPSASAAERAARAALSAHFSPEEVSGARSDGFDPVAAWAELTDAAPAGQFPDSTRWVLESGERTARFVVPGDAAWPTALEDLGERCPLGLWVLGDLGAARAAGAVAVVGNRASSDKARQDAARLSMDLSDQGRSVVSSLAFGVEAAAQEAARPDAVVAVLPRGLNRCHPHANGHLLRRAAARGAAVSLQMARKPATINSLKRAAWLTVALSRAVVVVEAMERSSVMEYARAALALERPLYVVPQPAGEFRSSGGRRLLDEGRALPCLGAGDLPEVL